MTSPANIKSLSREKYKRNYALLGKHACDIVRGKRKRKKWHSGSEEVSMTESVTQWEVRSEGVRRSARMETGLFCPKYPSQVETVTAPLSLRTFSSMYMCVSVCTHINVPYMQ